MQSFNPAPNRLEEVVTPEWLTAMLSARWPNAIVHKVTVVETLATQATKVRLALDVEGGDADLPTHICIKGVLTDTGAPAAASIAETRFYQEFAGKLPVRVPPCIHAGLTEAGDNGVIVMKDLIEAGATFLSALDPMTPDEARQTLDQLAQLHAQAWEGSASFERPWLRSFLDQISKSPIIPEQMLQELLNGPRGEPLPAELRDAARLQRALEALAAQVRERPLCLVHGDAHAGNIYRQGDGFGLVDWQVLQKGEWAQDVAYHLAAVLTPEDRRAHERELLGHYLQQLKAHGGPDISADEAWDRYRVAMIYGYYMWSITRKVDPQHTNEFVRKLGLAVHELESYALAGV